jgi:hypothetical protein
MSNTILFFSFGGFHINYFHHQGERDREIQIPLAQVLHGFKN